MNITKLPSGNYRIRETVNGINYSKTIKFKPKKYEAEQIIAEMIGNGDTSVVRITVEAAMRKLLERKEKKLSPSTISRYYGYINNYPKELLGLPLSVLTDDLLQKYINQMSKGKSRKYMKNLVSFLKSSITEYRKKYHPDVYVPTDDGISKSQRYEPVDSDIKAIVKEIQGSVYEIPIKLAMLGLRRSEICALTINDVGDCSVKINKVLVLDKDKKWVVKRLLKNGDIERTVFIPKELELKIREQGFIYEGHPGSIGRYLSVTLQKLHIEHFSLHRLRHYYASVSHAIGLPDAYIMRNGGWKTDEVLKRVYRHAQDDKIDQFNKVLATTYDQLFTS